MKLSILIPVLPQRAAEVVGELYSQAGELPSVEILVDMDAKGTSGQKRQRLLERANGEYIAYCDDDDMVAPSYVRRLLSSCESNADVISFDLHFVRPGRGGRERWSFGLWDNNRKAGKMCVNHLCAWRRSLAQRVAWCPDLGWADDHLWFEPLFHSGLIQLECHIDEVLYLYDFDPAVTANQTHERIRHGRDYYAQGLPCYRDDLGEMYIGQPDGQARDRNNSVIAVDPAWQVFHHVRAPQ